ncbi:MAG: tetratricopeptide repeat protein [Xanthomonadales bacterium]|nr:tetratricopeptide repeat protein [Xanthomonadales bacterium]
MSKATKKKRSRSTEISIDQAMLMGIQVQRLGLLSEAETIYKDVLRLVPDHPDAIHYIGLLMHQIGDSEAGIKHILRSLELAPNQPGALNNLGNIYKEMGRLEEAEVAYGKVLEMAPQYADTWVNLGIILRNSKKPEAALEKLLRAIEINPEHPDAYHNLGNVYGDLKQVDEAMAAYEKSMAITPSQGATLKATAKLQFRLGRKEQAIRTMENWVARRPDDAVARHLLAAYSGENIPARASNSYVRQEFDSFSSSFDEVLTRLDYNAPDLVATRAKQVLSGMGRQYNILDIGCGTGLCGPLLKPLAASLTGVDLSPGMLCMARKRNVYDVLREDELTAFMQDNPGQFDVVTCVDTFVYFGDLSAAFAACSETLNPGGWLFFTVERHALEENLSGYWLRPRGRYSHTREHLENLLTNAGLTVESSEDVILRNEGDKPVSGLLFSAHKR